MNYNQFKNISCYEEFEIKSTLTGISRIDILRKIGGKINDYYFFVSNDGIFNWFDLEGNHVEDPGVLKELKTEHIPQTISECIIPDSVTSIGEYSFYNCNSLKEVIFKGKTLEEVKQMIKYPFGIKDESIIKVSEI